MHCHPLSPSLTFPPDNLWLTPAFQGKKFAHEAVLLLLSHLFGTLNYRRVSYEVDSRHAVGRKFLLRCGFRPEGTLFKHRIVQQRNRDSCVYVVLNSDWPEVEQRLRSYCGIPPPRPKVHSIAEIDSIEEFVEGLDLQVEKRAGEAAGEKKSVVKRGRGKKK